MSRSTLRSALAAVGLAAALTILAGPLSATAATSTSIAFGSAEPTTAAFASDWVIPLVVTREAPPGPVQPGFGTVDVYVDGIAGAYVTGLPVQEGGVVYFAQPTGQPLLAAGDHVVRAIFNPQGGSGLTTSQTAQPVSLTITPLTVRATLSAVMDPSVSEEPIITASLSGAAVDAFGGAPSGTWTFTVTDPAPETVFTEEVAQDQGSTADIVVPVDMELRPGTEFAVSGTFVPHPTLAAGITVEGPSDASFTSASATIAEWLVAPVGAAWWMVIAAVAVLLLLLAATIWLGVLTARRRRATPAVTGAEPSMDTAPDGEAATAEAEAPTGDAPPADRPETDDELVDSDTTSHPA